MWDRFLKYKHNKCLYFITDGNAVHSLCPSLGHRHAQLLKDICPWNLQNPFGKEINISFRLSPPFFTHPPLGGSDFLIIKMLARKYGFIPRFIPEISYDNVQSNGSIYGLIHSVSWLTVLNIMCLHILKLF